MKGEGRMAINYILPKCTTGSKLKIAILAMQSGKPQLIAFLITDTMVNFVEIQHITISE